MNRKVDENMANAVFARKDWSEGHNRVSFSDAQTLGVGSVSYRGNVIVIIMDDGELRINPPVIREYPTMTTMRKLRALGFDARIKNGIPVVNGFEV